MMSSVTVRLSKFTGFVDFLGGRNFASDPLGLTTACRAWTSKAKPTYESGFDQSISGQ